MDHVAGVEPGEADGAAVADADGAAVEDFENPAAVDGLEDGVARSETGVAGQRNEIIGRGADADGVGFEHERLTFNRELDGHDGLSHSLPDTSRCGITVACRRGICNFRVEFREMWLGGRGGRGGVR